jgi:clan AA aspartic protease (TIGR02281 family)
MPAMSVRFATFAFAAGLLLIPAGARGVEFYRWVDQNGVIHFTDNMHNVPAPQRDGAGRIQAVERYRYEPPPAAANKASVPYEKQGQVVIVEATLNNKTSAKFIVDTGASYTMISSATAKELAVGNEANSRTVPFQTANGLIQAPLVSLDSIAVAGMEIKNLTAAVHDVIPDGKIAGLLGLNFLTNFRIDIDAQKGVLHLEKK